ncbi:peptidoglycan DD-metalloendopeptidase family protein [Streptomyces sp. NPDC057694]|uniref:peptidoglycan DD-metalloendopeptidase family protein n=1 Tax=Streptomyces sp. NPDC057694 TaxID=3346216 RepID=UPI0036A4E6D4
MRRLLSVTIFLAVLSVGAAGAAVHAAGLWPVGDRPAVVRAWSPPATPYGPGHRGVDLAAPIGAPVRAQAAGRVSFAGRVAGRGVVSMELTGTGDPPLRTTYEPVTPTVAKGDEVAPGQVLGTLELPTGHCPPTAPSCLHWGLLRGDTYLDPLSLLDPSLLRHRPARLLPVWDIAPTASGNLPPLAYPASGNLPPAASRPAALGNLPPWAAGWARRRPGAG